MWLHRGRRGNFDLGDGLRRDIEPEDMKPLREAGKTGRTVCSVMVGPKLVRGLYLYPETLNSATNL